MSGAAYTNNIAMTGSSHGVACVFKPPTPHATPKSSLSCHFRHQRWVAHRTTKTWCRVSRSRSSQCQNIALAPPEHPHQHPIEHPIEHPRASKAILTATHLPQGCIETAVSRCRFRDGGVATGASRRPPSGMLRELDTVRPPSQGSFVSSAPRGNPQDSLDGELVSRCLCRDEGIAEVASTVHREAVLTMTLPLCQFGDKLPP